MHTDVMASSETVSADVARAARYAQQAGYLLHSIPQNATLARVQMLRASELEQQLRPSDRKQLRGAVTACSLCGTSVVPGWTGSMHMSCDKVGRRKQKRGGHQAARRNRLEWTCSTCGSRTFQPGSDANTKSRFGPVKKHAPLSKLLSRTPRLPRSRSQLLNPEGKQQDIPKAPSVTQRASPVRAAPHKPQNVPTNASTTATAVVGTNSTQKKKRTKREGLQAMLLAKKEQEEKAKQAAGSLGLNSFLKGLQG